MGDLVFGVLKDMYIRENEDKNSVKYCNVGKDKSVGYKVDKEENGGGIIWKDLN